MACWLRVAWPSGDERLVSPAPTANTTTRESAAGDCRLLAERGAAVYHPDSAALPVTERSRALRSSRLLYNVEQQRSPSGLMGHRCPCDRVRRVGFGARRPVREALDSVG